MSDAASPNITEEIKRLRGLLSKQLQDAQLRLSAAQAGLAAAQTELEVASAGQASAEKQFSEYNALFQQQQQQPAAIGKANGKAGPVAKPGPVAKSAAPAKAVVHGKPKGSVGRPTTQSVNSGTVPERLAAVMGRRIWTAPELHDALEAAGVHLQSNNIRSYISTTLNSTMKNAPADVRGRDGKPMKVHLFTNVERGRYRVASQEDIQAEIQKIREAEAAEGADGSTPADEVFAQRGIDVRAAVGAH